MKNLITYYFLVFAPLFILFSLNMIHSFDHEIFLGLLFFYAFIYRTLTDYYRLKSKNILSKNDFWRILIPGSRIYYFKGLFFI